MGNLISYIVPQKSEEQLTPEEIINILKNSDENKKQHHDVQSKINENENINSFTQKLCTINEIINNTYVLDGIHIFPKNDTNFNVGSEVLCDFVTSNGQERIVKIVSIDTSWDNVERVKDVPWIVCTKLGKVEKRVGRKLHVTGNITIDMSLISMLFVPVVGDWVELETKCAVDENSLNLTGNIVEIDKVSPVRAHFESGQITMWNVDDNVGIINRKIFFNLQSLSCGYIPKLKDKVVAQVVESEQGNCNWRAVQVLPQSTYVKNIKGKRDYDFIEDYPGIEIETVNLKFKGLNLAKDFDVKIRNNGTDNLVLKSFSFNANSQCKVLNKLKTNLILTGGDEYTITCECVTKTMGLSRELLVLTFENFKLGTYVNVTVTSNQTTTSTGYNYCNKNVTNFSRNSENQLVRGPNFSARFKSARTPTYSIPQDLLETVQSYHLPKESSLLEDKLRGIKPVIFNNLNFTIYEGKFHSLLHLQEISEVIAIRNYDQERACFIPNNEHLMLEIENLTERRPSIVLGDKIIASDPLNRTKIDYEGRVDKVSAKHIYLKFSQRFHEQYKGEDYSIRVVASRGSYIRMHHAVFLAARNLGPEILFPTKLHLNEPVELKQIEWFNIGLNEPQKNAVINILKETTKPLPYIIFGPPGTGKTVTLIEIIFQIIRHKPEARLLITAPSNSAADLIALRLINFNVLKPGDLIRLIGVNYAESQLISKKLLPYCATCSSAIEHTVNDEGSTRNSIRIDLNKTAIGRHKITITTCDTAGRLVNMGFPKGHFSHIIIDEAAQASEPTVMIPMSLLDKSSGQIILAGDPMQLGPVIQCKIADEHGLNESYLERLTNRFPYAKDPEGYPHTYGFDPRLITKLVYNYRALPDILNLYSLLFYHSELIPTIDTENSNEADILNKLEDMLPTSASHKPCQILFHGVKGENFQTSDSPSWYNPDEAAQVFYYVNELFRLGLKKRNIGIISPYIKQVKEIRSVLTEAEFDVPKIGTVEEFQGQEFDIIILSTVRSSKDYLPMDLKYSLGFVSSPKRLNVAISRARALLIIIGNPILLAEDIYWRSVLEYCVGKGCYVGCEINL